MLKLSSILFILGAAVGTMTVHAQQAGSSAVGLLVAPASLMKSQKAIADAPNPVFGFHDFASEQAAWDKRFLDVPNPELAGENLRTLTAAPHVAGSIEDLRTAELVERKFREAGLTTKIVKYSVWLNSPGEQSLTVTARGGRTLLKSLTPEHVANDPFQNDKRVIPGFNSSSAAGDSIADVVYANYGSAADFRRLEQLGISVKGKIVLVRYGQIFRGGKVFNAQQRGAAGVLIYSDPSDDGYVAGDIYPHGPYGPATKVQRGTVAYMFEYPGDPTTPGFASTSDLPASKRITPGEATSMPHILSLPISYHDAQPILEHLGGPDVPNGWQGGLPFHYHLGGDGQVRAHLKLKPIYKFRTIWDVIGTIPGEDQEHWVVAGNHRDAWTFGAVDPSSGTASMLEAVRGFGVLLKAGWHPKRTIVFGSWDAEEEGLVGSTEWAEEHADQLRKAVIYVNMDGSVVGPDFTPFAVPSLKNFLLDVIREVPSPKGGTVYEQWLALQLNSEREQERKGNGGAESHAAAPTDTDRVPHDLWGSDSTPFLQHLGVPTTMILSDGPEGVYHSMFDDYAWFAKYADPTFEYLQQMARVFGLEVLHMADSDVLPFDYVTYAKEIRGYLSEVKDRAIAAGVTLDMSNAIAADEAFLAAAQEVRVKQLAAGTAENEPLNIALRDVEVALLSESGLPNRPWYRHTIYAPGRASTYAGDTLVGVNEALDAGNTALAQQQLLIVASAITRAARTLQDAR